MKTGYGSLLRFLSRGIGALSFCIIAIYWTDAAAGPSVISLVFRDSVLVNDTVFIVGDIAEVNGNDGDIVAAVTRYVAGVSAPPGYARFISTADFVACQLKNRFPDVRFSTGGSKRPLVRTDYRVVRISDHETALRAWIDSAIGWRAGEWTATFDNLSDSCKVYNAQLSISFRGLENRFPKGQTNLALLIHQGPRIWRIPVRCRFSVVLDVVVALNPVSRGEVITPQDCTIRRMDITRFAPKPYTSLDKLHNKRAMQSIRAGTILHDRLLLNIPVIEKGDAVSIILHNGRFSIAVAGIARQRGGIGDRIWVENQQTRKLIRAQIREKGIVSPVQRGVSI